MGFFGKGPEEGIHVLRDVPTHPGLKKWLEGMDYDWGQLGPAEQDIEAARGVGRLGPTYDAAAEEAKLRAGWQAQQPAMAQNIFQTLKEQLGGRGARLQSTGRGQLAMAEGMQRQLAPQALQLEQFARGLGQFGSQAEQARRQLALQSFLGAGGLGAQRGQLSLQEMIGLGLPQFSTFAPNVTKYQKAADPGMIGKIGQIAKLVGSVAGAATGMGGVGSMLGGLSGMIGGGGGGGGLGINMPIGMPGM